MKKEGRDEGDAWKTDALKIDEKKWEEKDVPGVCPRRSEGERIRIIRGVRKERKEVRKKYKLDK